MKKNLLIFSGSTNPTYGKYPDRYNLVISEAKKIGYIDVQLVNWTGQKSSNKKGAFSMQSALIDAISEIEKCNNLKQKFDLITFSWGCGIALRSLQLLQNQLVYLDKTILWGVSPFWKEYEAMEINKHKSLIDAYCYSGCFVDKDYLEHQIPIEYLLSTYNGKNRLKIGAGCVGGDDNFLKYIDSIVDNNNISFHYLKDSCHVVTAPDQDYINFLFN